MQRLLEGLQTHRLNRWSMVEECWGLRDTQAPWPHRKEAFYVNCRATTSSPKQCHFETCPIQEKQRNIPWVIAHYFERKARLRLWTFLSPSYLIFTYHLYDLLGQTNKRIPGSSVSAQKVDGLIRALTHTDTLSPTAANFSQGGKSKNDITLKLIRSKHVSSMFLYVQGHIGSLIVIEL